MDMSDEELIPFFENDLKKSPGGSQSNVREIPNGDVMFTMCVFQGKTRPVLAFMDSGCNVWVQVFFKVSFRDAFKKKKSKN